MYRVKKILLRYTAVTLMLGCSAFAQDYDKTSYYVAYDTNDNTQYALVMPSVQKVYTHVAGHIQIDDLSSVGEQLQSFPTYSNGELCFPALKDGASGDHGASIMANKCYDVKFFYIQKERVSEGFSFLLYYKPLKRVYEGLAGKPESFKVVKDGQTIQNDNSISHDDYTNFSFDIASSVAKMQPGSAIEDPNATTMVLNKAYQIQEGDKIEKRSEDAIVKIEAALKEHNTTATLQQGAAVIVR